MMAEAPRANRLAARIPAITSITHQRHHRDHHPGTRQEPIHDGLLDARLRRLQLSGQLRTLAQQTAQNVF
ncbi:MAG TPA: hypothetical protein VEY69_16795, partial [Lautropia sp.]|nr:hypothetical protein [Lautropia sp.]